jgi:N-acetylneuraminic acid mutarotase
MRKEMDDLAKRLDVVQTDVKGVQKDTREVKDEVKLKLTQEEFIRNLMDQVARQNDVVDDLCHTMNDMKAEMECLTKESNEKSEWFAGRSKIFVCGGQNDKYNLNSVESYSWPENSWTLEPAMKEARSGPSAFVHERQIYVSGGWTGTDGTDNIESLNGDEENIAWIQSPLKMPIMCSRHTMVSHENSAILIGGLDGDNVSDGIYEIKINPPYTSKLLTQMPEPRCNHGCHIIDNQVVVVGGRTSKYHKDAKNTVYVYDLNNNECKTLPPLPFAVANMASVSYKRNVILIGGVNEKAQTLNSVVMYDVKTGKIKMLPCLNHKRAGSAAVITGNVIIVMAGYDYETETYLSSVECLDLSSNVWRELSPMTTKRGFGTAVVKPIS